MAVRFFHPEILGFLAAAVLFPTAVPADAGNRAFPRIAIQSFAPTTVHQDARRFQQADFDARRNRVLFYPEGDFPFPLVEPHPTALGVLLVYGAGGKFTDPASYRAYDLKRLVSPKAGGFCGGFLDEKGDHAYLVPLYDIVRGEGFLARRHAVPNGLTVRIDLGRDLADPYTYQSFDVAALGFSSLGFCGGIAADGHAYFGPASSGETFGELSGILLSYDERMDFADRKAWQWFDLKRIDKAAIGFQGIAAIAPYVYLVPYFRPVAVRYDTRLALNDPAAYQTFDLGIVTPEPLGLCGVVAVGNRLIFTPLIDSKHLHTISTALLYDASRPFNDAAAWQALDLRKVDPRAAGYQSGWLDRDGFVWFVPDSTLFGDIPPLIAWDSRLPFGDPRSWKVYRTEGLIPASTGAAYDARTNRAWLSPYGDKKSFNITQIEAH